MYILLWELYGFSKDWPVKIQHVYSVSWLLVPILQQVAVSRGNDKQYISWLADSLICHLFVKNFW